MYYSPYLHNNNSQLKRKMLYNNNMVKFITPKEETVSFDRNYSEVNEDMSPIKEILKKGDYSAFSIVINNEEPVSLGEVFQLQVNVKEVGTFHFIFKKDGFNKEEAIKQVSTLKELSVNDPDSARFKVKTLMSVLREYNPLFIVYKESVNTYYYSYQLETSIAYTIPVFAITQPGFEEEMTEFIIGDDPTFEEATTQVKKKKAFKISKGKILTELSKNKFSLLLVFVSALLLQVSIPLAILNIYAKNTLYIFLFICGAIGIAMNGYCYFDYFKSKNFYDPLFLMSVIANVVGLGSGIGAFAIFYNISTKAEGTPALGTLILIGSLISIILTAALVALAYFIPRKNKANNKK